MVVNTVSLEYLARKLRNGDGLTEEELERLAANGEYLLTAEELEEVRRSVAWTHWWRRRLRQA